MTNEELQEELHSAFTELAEHLDWVGQRNLLNTLEKERDRTWYNPLNAPGPRIHMLIQILEEKLGHPAPRPCPSCGPHRYCKGD